MIRDVAALWLAGVALLFLEMFLPGMIAGIAGGVLLIAATVTAYMQLGTGAGHITLCTALAATLGLWWWWATKFRQTRLGRHMTLGAQIEGNSGPPELERFTGQTGTVTTPLRPSGSVTVAGQRLDATTDGEFLDTGTAITVIRSSGLGIVVRRA